MFDFIFENEKSASSENWEEVKAKVQERLDNWLGEEYHDDAKEYRGEVSLGGKVFSFSVFALLDDDGCMSFGNVVSIKRVK